MVLQGFSAGYVEVQGDGIFGLFAGQRSMFFAAALRHHHEDAGGENRGPQVQERTLQLIGTSRLESVSTGEPLLVRQLGLKGTDQNEVWAGMPVNAAAKLSSVAEPDEIVVSERVISGYERSAKVRQRALFGTCGCEGRHRGEGLSATGQASRLWEKQDAPKNLGLDFTNVYRRKSGWCELHGAEYCEAIVTGKPPQG